jgi:hypothetical protein
MLVAVVDQYTHYKVVLLVQAELVAVVMVEQTLTLLLVLLILAVEAVADLLEALYMLVQMEVRELLFFQYQLFITQVHTRVPLQ